MSHHHKGATELEDDGWRVALHFDDADGELVATAELFMGDHIYEAHGHTHAEVLDSNVARELAIARALSGLAHQLVDDASRNVDRVARAVATVADEAAETYATLDG
ncbi:MAG TPA: dsRBD fold-containing protein [Acidimicrobiales bacterium]|nr:dsRBD fold-containing protein [Acidimicrobiales bacterium]